MCGRADALTQCEDMRKYLKWTNFHLEIHVAIRIQIRTRTALVCRALYICTFYSVAQTHTADALRNASVVELSPLSIFTLRNLLQLDMQYASYSVQSV